MSPSFYLCYNGEEIEIGGIHMSDWFTVERIDNDTYVISEEQHWEETHCYLLCGSQIAVLIDTGLGVENIKTIVDQLTQLPVHVITTHCHWDHIGSHHCFDYIAVHVLEKEWLSGHFPLPLEVVKKNLTLKPCRFPDGFHLDDYQIFQGTPQQLFSDHDILSFGNRQLQVIHTPGHSPGHCCFYEADRGYLFSGDLIYKGCLDAFYPTTNPMQFYQSVEKVKQLTIKKVLPAHHDLQIIPSIIADICQAFKSLDDQQLLKQGNGLFDFGDFQIHI